jgi:putative endonuclease
MSGRGNQDVGLWGEREAERYLRRKRYRILGRRVRVGRRDELDLVARDGETLVFVEVKTRATEAFGAPVAAVDRRKRQALSRAAVRYLRSIRFPAVNIRFDVIEVVGSMDAAPPVIRHLPNVFVLDRRYRLPF